MLYSLLMSSNCYTCNDGSVNIFCGLSGYSGYSGGTGSNGSSGYSGFSGSGGGAGTGTILLGSLTVNLQPTISILYSALGGTFQVGETITDTAGSTATVLTDNGSNFMTLTSVAMNESGSMTGTINGGTSGAHAHITTFSWGDQAITLSNTNSVPVDVVFDAISQSATVAEDVEIWSGIGRTGTNFYTVNPHFHTNLNAPGKFLSYLSGLSSSPILIQMPTRNVYFPQTLYVTFGKIATAATTVNLNVYGYSI